MWDHLKTQYILQNWAFKWNTLGKLYKIHHEDCKNIPEFMTKTCNIKSAIKDLQITIDEAITIQVLNSLNSFFTQFLGILCYKAKKKAVLLILENLAKCLEDKKLQMRNQDKATVNYAK